MSTGIAIALGCCVADLILAVVVLAIGVRDMLEPDERVGLRCCATCVLNDGGECAASGRRVTPLLGCCEYYMADDVTGGGE